MAEPICEDDDLMQEWTPLTQLLQQIPLTSHRGLFSKNLNLTCVDAVPEFIALGTNLGFIYWYRRANADLQRLRLENYNCSVTCVKILPLSDYIVAAGTSTGTVIIFKIPMIQCADTIDQKESKQKQMERFTVNGLHKSSVTTIEGDSKEMKIFSGDKTGRVVLTEVDISLHISKSMELLNEHFEIIQLSYSQNILVISTICRSVVCDGSNKWKVHQVGTKERKMLGKFGAALCKYPHGTFLFASRPGHRLWLSDKNGIVQQTLIFKSAVQSNCSKIQLINPVDKKGSFDTSFGKIIQFGDSKLITYNSEIMYILHPEVVSVISVLSGVRKILDLAVGENEIFVLEGERSLLRIASLPDKYSLDMLYQPISRRTSFNLDEFAAKLKDTAIESIKRITKDLITTAEQLTSTSPPALADEALEVPSVAAASASFLPTPFTETYSTVCNQNFIASSISCPYQVGTNSSFLTYDMNNISIFNQNLQEEIVIKPLPRRHKKRKPLPNLKSNFVSESVSDTTSNRSEDSLDCDFVNNRSFSDELAISESQSRFSAVRGISPLLTAQKTAPKNYKTECKEMMKTSLTKSQTSVDTCESASERLRLISEPFREEPKKAFALLPDHSLLDSYNSERTDNMSISLNITTPSSVCSKISENLPSPISTSENSGMAFRVKSAESQSTDNFENEFQSPSTNCWIWNSDFIKTNSGQDENIENSSETSISNRNSQKEASSKRLEEIEGRSIGSFAGHPTNELKLLKEITVAKSENCKHEPCFFENIAASSSLDLVQDSKIQDTSKLLKSFRCSELPIHHASIDVQHFSLLENFSASEELEKKDTQQEQEGKKENYFLSDEPLNYGPPSGSSILSSQPSSDFTSIPIPQQFSKLLSEDFFDHWLQYKTPQKITSLDACNNYVICTDYKNRVYYSPLPGLSLSWKRLDHNASMVQVTNDCSAVWLLMRKEVSALVNVSSNSPISDSIEYITDEIRTFAIDSTSYDAVLVTLSGKIITFDNVSKGLWDNEIMLDCIITDVACSGGVIFAVSNDCIILCKMPEEDQFKVVKTRKPATFVALGPENLLWMVDDGNDIFFSDDYMSQNPHWWQVKISDYIFQSPPPNYNKFNNKMDLTKSCFSLDFKADIQIQNCLIATNDNSVWIYNKFGSTVHVNKTGFTGYMWNKVPRIKPLPSIQWQALCAGGAAECKGLVWLLSSDGNIFCIIINHQYLQPVVQPCEDNLVCVTSFRDTLWVLSENGGIYSRLGLSNGTESGTSWKEIKSFQIDNFRFVWISCGINVVWACDIHGRTFISTGASQHLASLDPNWIEVEGRPKDVQFKKVFVGSQPYMVWAIDSDHNLYIREGIFPHYQIGTSWVYVYGVEASHVTISGLNVWVLTPNGNIYRRCGVSESNFAGDYWRSIPGNLKMISSSLTNELWGISDDNNVLQLSYKLKILKKEKVYAENEETSYSQEDSWEIVK